MFIVGQNVRQIYIFCVKIPTKNSLFFKNYFVNFYSKWKIKITILWEISMTELDFFTFLRS